MDALRCQLTTPPAINQCMAHRDFYPISKEKGIGYDNILSSEEENNEYVAGNKVEHGLFSLSECFALKDSTIRTHDVDNEMVKPKTPNAHRNADVIDERLDVWFGNSGLETLQPEAMVCFQKDNCQLMEEKHHFDETKVGRFWYSVRDEISVLEKGVPAVDSLNSKLSFDIIKGVLMQRRFEGDVDADNYKEEKNIMEEEIPLKNININDSIPQSIDDYNSLNLTYQAVLEESKSQFSALKSFSEEHNINRNPIKVRLNDILDGTPHISIKEEDNKGTGGFLQSDQVTCTSEIGDVHLSSKKKLFRPRGHPEFNHSPHLPTSSRQNSFLPQLSYSGSISHRSDSSTKSEHSFTFPVLQAEWNSSPVRMPHADRGEHFRQHRTWERIGFPCCRF